MPSIFGHTAAGLGIALAFSEGRPSARLWATATICAVVPDVDWFGEFFHLPQALSHRGATHSLLAALCIAAAAMYLAFRPQLRSPRHWMCLLTAALSHGMLDACTFGGTGVAFFFPFSGTRFFSLWQPIFVSPAPLNGRLLDWFLFSLGTEILWIGVPTLLLFVFLRTPSWFGYKSERMKGS
jgi:inner membrane protein